MTMEKRLFDVFLMWKTKQVNGTIIRHNEYITILVNVGGIEYLIEPYDTFYTVSDGVNTRVIDGHSIVNE